MTSLKSKVQLENELAHEIDQNNQLIIENARLKREIDELEDENAQLRNKLQTAISHARQSLPALSDLDNENRQLESHLETLARALKTQKASMDDLAQMATIMTNGKTVDGS